MRFAPGTRLGPFEVSAQLGVGGMGEVYRAIDTNLKRQVAIRCCPRRSQLMPIASRAFNVKPKSLPR